MLTHSYLLSNIGTLIFLINLKILKYVKEWLWTGEWVCTILYTATGCVSNRTNSLDVLCKSEASSNWMCCKRHEPLHYINQIPLFYNTSNLRIPLFYNTSNWRIPLFYNTSNWRMPLFYNTSNWRMPLFYNTSNWRMPLFYNTSNLRIPLF